MSRPKRTSLDPSWFEHGAIAKQTATLDTYPSSDADATPGALLMVLDEMVQQLPEPDRSAVQMTVMSGYSYQEAAEMLEPQLGRLVDRKTLWRWARRGLLTVKERLGDAPWASVLTEGRIPLLDDDILPD